MSIKALQLTWHSASNRCLVAFWHQPWMPQRPSAACATRLSAQSVIRILRKPLTHDVMRYTLVE